MTIHLDFDSFNDYINNEKERILKDPMEQFFCDDRFKCCYRSTKNLKFREIISQNTDLFNVILNSCSDDILKIGLFLTGECEYNMIDFLNDCKITIWDIFFRYNFKNLDFNNYYCNHDTGWDDEFNTTKNQYKIFNIINFSKSKFQDHDLKKLRQYLTNSDNENHDNVNKVLEIIYKLDLRCAVFIGLDASTLNVFNAIKFIVENSYNFKIWQQYINMTIALQPKELEHIYTNFKWVLLNIDYLNVYKISIHIDYYIDSNKNKSFKYFCYNVLNNLNNIIKICELKPVFKEALRVFLNDDYLNKIMCVHSNTEILNKIYTLFGEDIFKIKDSKDFHILSDCLRYGDLECLKWMFDNILTDSDDLNYALNNLFNDLQGFSYVLENKDWRILDYFLNKLSQLISHDQLINFDWNLINISKICNFSKKAKILIEFIKNNCIEILDYYNFVKDILFTYENDICKNKSLILEELHSNRQYVRFNKLSQIILNNFNKNLDSIKKIIDIYRIPTINDKLNDIELNTFIIKNLIDDFRENNYYQALYYNKKVTYSLNNTMCICKLKQTILDIYNYAYNKNFEIQEFYNVMKITNLKIINNFNNYCWNYEYNDKCLNYTFNNLLEILYNLRKNSIKHKCCTYNNDQIEDEIIIFFKNLIVVNSRNNFINLYNHDHGITFFSNEYDFSNNFLKKLLFNQFYFKYYKNILHRDHYPPITYKLDKPFLRSFSNYYIDNKNYSRTIKENYNEIKKFRILLVSIEILDNYLLDIDNLIKKGLKTCDNSSISTFISSEYKKLVEEKPINIFKILNELKSITLERAYTFKKNIYLNKITKLLYVITEIDITQFNKKKFKNILIDLNKLHKTINGFTIYLKSIIEIQKTVISFFQLKVCIRKKISNNFNTHKKKLEEVCLDILDKKKNVNKNEALFEKNQSNKSNELLLDLLTSLSDIDNTSFIDKSDIISLQNSNNENKNTTPFNLENNNLESISITKPSLINIKNILQNFRTHTIITLKIDGVTQRSKSLSNAYPICPINTLFDIEYVEKDNMHFIIGISNSHLFGKSRFIDEINNLRNQHEWTKDNCIPKDVNIKTEFHKIIDILKLEASNYLKYINESKKWANNGKKLWWPKLFFDVSENNFLDYIKSINLIICYFSSFVHRNTMINDGWILMNKNYLSNKDLNKEHLRAFKIKPRNLMTIDLKFINGEWFYNQDNFRNFKSESITENFSDYFTYLIQIKDNLEIKNNSIYRCYPIFEEDIIQYGLENSDYLSKIKYFEARDLRTDKKHPNTKLVLKGIFNEINNYWTFSQLLTCINNDKPQYYTLKFENKVNNLNKYKFNIKYNVLKKYTIGSLLDIGGGSSTKKYIKGIEDQITSCVSTDNDLNIIISNNTKNEDCLDKLKIEYNYLDFTSNNSNSICRALSLENQIFDTVYAMNCINFAFENSHKFKTFSENINNFTKINSKILIRFMDLEAFTRKIFNLNKNNLIKNKQMIIKSGSNPSFINIDFEKKINRIYFSWAHESPINESMIAKTDLECCFNNIGWEFTEYEVNKNYKNLNANSTLWDIYFNSFSTIVFTRKL